MSIASLSNINLLDSSFHGDTQSQTPRRPENNRTERNRASSVLQMWRDLEDDHMVNAQERVSERLSQQRITDISDNNGSEHSAVTDDVSFDGNEFGQWSPTLSRVGSRNSSEDPGNFHCEHFSDLGEVERERVRRTFREWMNTGPKDRTSRISNVNKNSREEWLGETEQERVRSVREWVQLNCQHRGVSGDTRVKQGVGVSDQIGPARDGVTVNQNGGRPEYTRRGIRRLCGRQALLDMVKKAESERQIELQGLLEHRSVSSFAHRNRIQSLLRGRFLRNDRTVEEERPNSLAASELGLLRERQTVSGLREGFISRLGHYVCGQKTNRTHSDTSSSVDIDSDRVNENHGINLHEGNSIAEQSERSNEETSHELLDGGIEAGDNIVQEINWRESTARVEEWQGQGCENVVRRWQQSASIGFSETTAASEQGLDEQWEENIADDSSQLILENETGEYYHLQEASEMFYAESERSSVDSARPVLRDTIETIESNLGDSINQQVSTAPEHREEEAFESTETYMQGTSGESFEPRDSNGDVRDEYLEESTTNEWSRGLLGSGDGEQLHLQEAPQMQHDDGDLQEGRQNWLEGPSDLDVLPVGRTNRFYLPDEDNVYSMELRELVSRRRVSNLLHSGFRESLNQLIQSYVERQNHATVDWELDETSPTALASGDQDLEQQSGHQSEGQGDVESPRLALPSSPLQPLLDQVPQRDDWPPRQMHPHFGIELDVINDLRVDMARMQQRINSMQRMLETCMDMQIELQRSIRQEVSAALNQSTGSPGTWEDSLVKDGSKWDHVRKGMCCICLDSNIDSLLFRCGHMCTCSKCATDLVRGGGKCPMCWAPIVEVIRAYSIS